MAVAGRKHREFMKYGAGGWALILALFLLCLLLVSSKRGEESVKTELEIRMERMIEKVEGAGESHVLINEENGAVKGVLIICEGAEDISVRLRVQEAAHAVLDTENERIHVMPMEGK